MSRQCNYRGAIMHMLLLNCTNVTAHLGLRCRTITHMLLRQKHVAAGQHVTTQKHKLKHMSWFNNPHIKAQKCTCQSSVGHMLQLNKTHNGAHLSKTHDAAAQQMLHHNIAHVAAPQCA